MVLIGELNRVTEQIELGERSVHTDFIGYVDFTLELTVIKPDVLAESFKLLGRPIHQDLTQLTRVANAKSGAVARGWVTESTVGSSSGGRELTHGKVFLQTDQETLQGD